LGVREEFVVTNEFEKVKRGRKWMGSDTGMNSSEEVDGTFRDDYIRTDTSLFSVRYTRHPRKQIASSFSR
jgi:hypothetical protein